MTVTTTTRAARTTATNSNRTGTSAKEKNELWHYSPETLKIERCTAEHGNCKYGSDPRTNPHHFSKEAMIEIMERRLGKSFSEASVLSADKPETSALAPERAKVPAQASPARTEVKAAPASKHRSPSQPSRTRGAKKAAGSNATAKRTLPEVVAEVREWRTRFAKQTETLGRMNSVVNGDTPVSHLPTPAQMAYLILSTRDEKAAKEKVSKDAAMRMGRELHALTLEAADSAGRVRDTRSSLRRLGRFGDPVVRAVRRDELASVSEWRSAMSPVLKGRASLGGKVANRERALFGSKSNRERARKVAAVMPPSECLILPRNREKFALTAFRNPMA